VTTPKLPPPPRIAKNKSVFSPLLAERIDPLAVMMVACLSQNNAFLNSLGMGTNLDQVVNYQPMRGTQPPVASAQSQTGEWMSEVICNERFLIQTPPHRSTRCTMSLEMKIRTQD